MTDPSTFTGFYWTEQLGTAGSVFVLTVVGGLIGGGLYGVFRPKAEADHATGGRAGIRCSAGAPRPQESKRPGR